MSLEPLRLYNGLATQQKHNYRYAKLKDVFSNETFFPVLGKPAKGTRRRNRYVDDDDDYVSSTTASTDDNALGIRRKSTRSITVRTIASEIATEEPYDETKALELAIRDNGEDTEVVRDMLYVIHL